MEKENLIQVVIIRNDYVHIGKIKNTLKELQGIIGGSIEVLNECNWAIIIDEEGKMKGKPRNALATKILETHLWKGDWIAGDAILVGVDGSNFTDAPIDVIYHALVNNLV